MHIYMKNIPAKFHPNPIWDDGALGFLEARSHKKKKKKNNQHILMVRQTS